MGSESDGGLCTQARKDRTIPTTIQSASCICEYWCYPNRSLRSITKVIFYIYLSMRRSPEDFQSGEKYLTNHAHRTVNQTNDPVLQVADILRHAWLTSADGEIYHTCIQLSHAILDWATESVILIYTELILSLPRETSDVLHSQIRDVVAFSNMTRSQ